MDRNRIIRKVEVNERTHFVQSAGSHLREKVGSEAIEMDCAMAACGININANAILMAVTLPLRRNDAR
jgi:hypothetical protein